ncbi:MAG: glutamate--cysteine ligase, partial [Candidatus Thermoplasmatota archaeon]|nr:glutamate--cysteine ligase [Candidatus Thermoplasmatota archaeon]
GILRIQSPDEVLNLSKRKMNRLTYAKGGKDAEDFLLQEAVPTFLKSNDSVIEPVGYGVNGQVISWFYRSNDKHGFMDNLNTPSTKFIIDKDLSEKASIEIHARRWLHELIANISMIAMGRENIDYDSSLEE